MILRPPTHALNAYGLDGTVYYNNFPLHKFLYAVVINMNPASGIGIDSERMTLIVKSVQIGGWNIDTEVVNEYNRSRLVHNRIQYDDTVITMHDVADGKALEFAEKYYTYFYGDGRGLFPPGGFGYDTATIQGNNRRYVIDSIDIYQFQARKANKTTLKYPKMIAFKQDTAEYSSLDGLMELTFTFKPEYIQYKRGVSLPGNVMSQLQRGGTAKQLASIIDTSIITEVKDDLKSLRTELLDELTRDTEAMIQDQLIDNVSGTAFTTSAVNSLSSGSVVTRASTSSLDSYGRVVQDLRRKVAPSTQKPTKKTFSLRAEKVTAVDGTGEQTRLNNTPNFQGGDG